MRILVCGDAIEDHYWSGAVTRLSPEAPVPIVTVTQTETRAGGAANVANTIEALGIQCERIFSRSERIRKIRLRSGQHIARIDFDHPQEPIDANANYAEALLRCEIVVLVDYGKGSLANVQALISKAREAHRPVLVDPKGHDYKKYSGATMLKPNQIEMRELIGGWSSQSELDFKVRQFLLVSGIESILLTQSEDGMTFYDRERAIHVASKVETIADVSGAGEAALAAYAAALAKRKTAQEAVAFANKAAGIAIAHQGTYVVKAEELWN